MDVRQLTVDNRQLTIGDANYLIRFYCEGDFVNRETGIVIGDFVSREWRAPTAFLLDLAFARNSKMSQML